MRWLLTTDCCQFTSLHLRHFVRVKKPSCRIICIKFANVASLG